MHDQVSKIAVGQAEIERVTSQLMGGGQMCKKLIKKKAKRKKLTKVYCGGTFNGSRAKRS